MLHAGRSWWLGVKGDATYSITQFCACWARLHCVANIFFAPDVPVKYAVLDGLLLLFLHS